MYEIFEKLLKAKNVTAYRVAKETGISTATLTQWKNGSSTPKTDKLQKIADYFGVSLNYLTTGEEKEDEPKYYLNDETAEIAQEIFENKELRMLFDVTRNASAKNLEAYYNMIKALESQEND